MNRAALRLRVTQAKTAQAALAPDDDGHVTTRVTDGVLRVDAASKSAMGLLRSIDDVLGCLRALEGQDD